MDKYLKILIGVLIFLFAGVAVWFLLELFGVIGKKETEKSQEVLPVEKVSGETTTIYGIEMQNKCFAQYKDFIKNYGSDYTTCMVDFDFNEEYCSGFDPETQALSDVNIIVILDSSGSMAVKIDSEERIDIAKKAVSDFLTKMPQGVNTGLVVYGHKGSNYLADKDLSCKGIEETVKLGKNNYSSIISAMSSFQARGWTPIAGSLDFAKDIFNSNGKNNKNYLVLLSDGIESCDGNPLAEAENLKLEVSDINLIVIGFATDMDTRQYLTKIAKMGGGSYLTADNSSDIAKVFDDQLLVIKKDCLKMTFSRMSFRYSANNLNNLNCWLDAYKKESYAFSENVSNDPDCGLEISNALKARHTEFWYQKRDLEEKNEVIYNGLKIELNDQLKALDSQS